MNRILYTKPSITELELEFVNDAARNGWGEQCYEYISRFESAFCQYTGAKYAIATSSCTGAMQMGLAALDIKAGDEVIVGDSNWIASVAPVVHLGAKPVFVDIDPQSWCLDPDLVEKAITPNTKAIIAVHLYGNLCDMHKLREISETYNVPIIEDSAEALGSFYHGSHAGSIGKFGVFSFHGTKTMTTGEGGMFITSDRALYDRVLMLSNHGRAPTQSKQFWAEEIGFKYKMSNLQAALGCAQLERIGVLVEKKREIFSRYQEAFSKFEFIKMNPEPEGTINSYWMPTLVFDRHTGITRESLLEKFSSANIDARVFFWPLSSMPYFKSVKQNPIALDIPGRAVNLPSYHDLTTEQQGRVCDVILSMLNKQG